ncbi:hypothetical protein M0G74_10440 [Microbulbifer sp. CAU 1566]|uniref:hypothetical protein n=1 Tax=Microbulbifer sp. CAU 1566 TaxID=2933269 RepID=UPI0020057B7A|nr:hypothetical protein [Microbulbifer sp. CAU 1566]MCK7597686.1 hypothetical protein [Microbulbifer sp. CAU 1566]
MVRPLLIAAVLSTFMSSLLSTGCSRQSDTHDPDHSTDKAPQTEVREEVIVDETTAPPATSPETSENLSGESPNSEGQLICNAEWFEWVNGQLMTRYSEAIAEQYPDGMPSVGSQEWFIAADKLTGGDGAHGPDGGSDEWCFMMQQRLGSSD